jgi:glycosyltransferase involved in cell wall biosynthesis
MNKYPGELAQSDRDTLLSTSYAALMPGAWPEPFGLVAVEALAGRVLVLVNQDPARGWQQHDQTYGRGA